jgi:glycine C-acetyltransferase
LPPLIAAVSLRVLELIRTGHALRDRLAANAQQFRAGISAAGFTLVPGEHPIIPVMLFDATLARRLADRLFELGVYVIGFSFPVVAKGQARIRTQMSAAHSPGQIEQAVHAFTTAGRELGIIS